jgi:putative transposase
MARPIRIEQIGSWYHITARGNERRAIYRDDRDRRHFLDLLGEMVYRFDLILHAYVLMDNHYHLLVELHDRNLSRAFQWLNVSYSVWFNRRHDRSGHLFQGRFKSVILDAEAWGLSLSRYVHLNPVHTDQFGLDKHRQQGIRMGFAGMPDAQLVHERILELRQYRWSSFRAYAGLEKAPAWLECRSVIHLGGGDQDDGARHYREYVEAELREGRAKRPWDELKEQVVLGSREFLSGLKEALGGDEREQRGVRRLLEERPRLTAVIQCVEKLKGMSWEEFRNRHGDTGRDLVLYLGRKLCGAKLDELAVLASLQEYASVAVAIKRFEIRLRRPGTEQEEYRQVMQLLNVKM